MPAHCTPPLTCTARGTGRRRQLLFAARPANCGPFVLRGLCRVESPPAVSVCSALFSRLCFACHLLPAMPTALISSCPRSVCLPPSIPPCFACTRFIPCAPGSSVRASSLLLGPAVCCQGQQFASCKNCPVGSCNTGLRWRPVHRVHLLTFTFFLQSP